MRSAERDKGACHRQHTKVPVTMNMEPMGISAYRLAREIHVPVSRIQDILHDRRKITADTSLRLARFFGLSDKYFLDMQNDTDIRELKIALNAEIHAIRPCQAVAM